MVRVNNILEERHLQALQDQGLAALVEPGLVRLHRSVLDGSESLEILTTTVIPTQLISYQTLVYVGFTTTRADQLWNEWENWPATGPQRETTRASATNNFSNTGLVVTLIDFMVGRVLPAGKPDTDGRHNDNAWGQCLDTCGVDNSVRDAIMDPRYTCIRQSESCVYWIVDTIQMRYAGLLEIQRQSHDGGGSESWDGRWSLETADGVRKLGHTVLYKSIDLGRLAGFWPKGYANCNIVGGGGANNNHHMNNSNNTGNSMWHVEKLLSFPPTSFSGRRAMFYFTPDPQVAAYYAAYAKRRSACETVVMVTLTIKDEDLASLEHNEPIASHEHLDETGGRVHYLNYPSPHWKQVVWRSKTAQSLPVPLRKYRDALLLIGTAAKGAQRMYEDMKIWDEMGDGNVLRVPGSSRPAIQYVFSDEEGGDFIREKGEFAVFPFSASSAELSRGNDDV